MMMEMNFEHLYFALKVFSLLITAFLFFFYRNYLKLGRMQFEKFYSPNYQVQKNVNLFIFTNIGLLIVFSGIITYFIMNVFASSKHSFKPSHFDRIYHWNCDKYWFRRSLIWLYYRIVLELL